MTKWMAYEVAKFFCVLFMVFIHSTFWLITLGDQGMVTQNFIYPIVQQVLVIGLFPLAIPVLAGIGLRLHLDPFWKNGRIPRYPVSQMIKVALLLAASSYLMNFLSWGFKLYLEWDALQFIGLSFLLITLSLKFLPAWFIVGTGAVVLVATPWLRDLISSRETFLTSVLVGTSRANSFWPFFPWFFSIVFGFGIAEGYLRLRLRRYDAILALAGGILMGLSALWGAFLFEIDPTNIWGPAIFQARIGFVLGLCGFSCLLLVISGALAERISFSKYGWVMSFSKGIFWIYLIHTIVGIRVSGWFKASMPLEVAALLFPSLMLLLSWGVGALSIWLGTKKIQIVFVKKA